MVGMIEAVLVRVPLHPDGIRGRDQIILLAQAVEDAVRHTGVGEYDGWEVRARGASIYAYGPSADALYEVVAKAVHDAQTGLSGVIVRRYGPPGAREVQEGF